jgi:hypothetical protein
MPAQWHMPACQDAAGHVQAVPACGTCIVRLQPHSIVLQCCASPHLQGGFTWHECYQLYATVKVAAEQRPVFDRIWYVCCVAAEAGKRTHKDPCSRVQVSNNPSTGGRTYTDSLTHQTTIDRGGSVPTWPLSAPCTCSARFPPVLHHFFLEAFRAPQDWFTARTTFMRRYLTLQLLPQHL